MEKTKDTTQAPTPAVTGEETKTFIELGTEVGLEPDLLRGLADMGYTHPTPVQREAIPAVAAGKDLMAQARTGTGKTLAFGLPTLHRINRTSPDTQVLVICPTRELAVQVADELARVSKHLQIIVAVVFGGVKVLDQVDEMQWAPVVVGTPGRLRDMIERGYLHLDTCKVVVLDEADEMLDMGFKDDLEFILGKCPKDKQTLLFSATFPPEITRIAHKYMREPEKIEVSSGYTAATNLQHKFARVPKDKKIQALATLLRQPDVTNSIVFCETKTECAWVFQRLKREGFNIGIITGDVPQEKRLATLQAFRDGELGIIVATDVAARGLDIPSVSHVFHFTVPRETATYVHRSGRTARAGRSGIAFTLVTPEEDRDFQRIMRDIKQVQAPQGGQARPAREEGRREGGREGGREGREPREPRREREEGRREGGREGREPREGRDRDRQPVAGVPGREEGRREGREPREGREGRDRGRERFGRDEGRAPQRAFAPAADAPAGLGEAIASLGGTHVDAYMGVAQSLLEQVDSARLVAALLSQNPRAISLLEAAQVQAQGGERAERTERPERGERADAGERGDRGGRGRDRGRGRGRDRFERGPRPETEGEAEAVAEVQAEPVAAAPAPAREGRRTRTSTPVSAPAAEAPAAPAPAPAAKPAAAAPAAKPAARPAAKPVAATAAAAPVPFTVTLDEPATPVTEGLPPGLHTRRKKAVPVAAPEPEVSAPVEEAKPKAATRTRKPAASKAAAPVEAPVEEAKPKAATRTRKPAAAKAEPAAEKAPAAEAPKAKAPAKKATTTSRAKKAST